MSSSKWFVEENETDTIILDEGAEEEAWVKIKTTLSIADQDQLGQLLMEIKIDAGNPEGLSRAERRRRAKDGKNIDAQLRPSTVALLQVSIVDWSFTDENANKIPITPERIGRLKPRWANQIEEAIDINNPLEGQTTPQNSAMLSKEDPLHFPAQPSDS